MRMLGWGAWLGIMLAAVAAQPGGAAADEPRDAAAGGAAARSALAADDFYGALNSVQSGLAVHRDDIELRFIRGTINRVRWPSAPVFYDFVHIARRGAAAGEVAQKLAKTKDPDQAWSKWPAAQRDAIDEDILRFHLGMLLIDTGRWKEAERQFAQIGGLSGVESLRFAYLAAAGMVLYLEVIFSGGIDGSPEEALEAFRNLVLEHPDDVPLRWALALGYQRADLHPEAATQFELLIDQVQQPPGWLHYGYAHSLAATGRLGPAIAQSQIAFDHTDSHEVRRRHAEILVAAGRWGEAADALDGQTIQIIDYMGDRHFLRDFLQRQDLDREALVRQYDRIMGDVLHQTDELYLKGSMLSDLGLTRDALDAFKRAAQVNNSAVRAAALRSYGYILQMGKSDFPADPPRAMPYLKQAAAAGDARAMTSLAYGLAFGRGVERNDGRAYSLYREAVRRGVFTALPNLGILYRGGRGVESDPDEAMVYYHRGMFLGDANSHNNAAWLLAQTPGFWDEEKAITWSETAVSKAPSKAHYNTLYTVYEKAEQWEMADDAWRRWEHWWRGQGKNRDRDLPDRWRRRLEQLDKRLERRSDAPEQEDDVE